MKIRFIEESKQKKRKLEREVAGGIMALTLKMLFPTHRHTHRMVSKMNYYII